MSTIKMISVSDGCILCGLCEQTDVSNVFTCDENGRIIVANSGMIDLDLYPRVSEIAKLCPVKAIDIVDAEISACDPASALDQFNHIVNKELRGYSFAPPEYTSYRYEAGQYQALPVPAKYRSDAKYLTDEAAEDAGFKEFKRAVYNQKQSIAKQYLVAYKIKQLKRYYTYEETTENFYFSTNKEISELLKKAYQLALLATDYKLKLPIDFCEFSVLPDWQATDYANKRIQMLEERDFDLSRSGFLHTEDYYRTYIHTDGEYKHCYYDFAEAEKTFREDIDSAISELIERHISEDVTALTNEYLQCVKIEVLKKCEVLQSEVKKLVKPTDSDQFNTSITVLYHMIRFADIPEVKAPYPENFDTDYNDDYRFYSLRDCEEAAGNRRDRGYEEGLSFLKNIHYSLNEAYQKVFAEELTQWKREALSIYDLTGRDYPNIDFEIHVGDKVVKTAFNSHEAIPVASDTSIQRYVELNLTPHACNGSVDGVSYVSRYVCEIATNYDCDIKETIFGNFKEVNKRYCYNLLDLYKFEVSASRVAEACNRVLRTSDFMENYFDSIKQSFAEELLKITGVSL